MTSIPASAIVAVTPNVLAAGGSALDLNGLVLTNNSRVPIGTVQSFSTAADVDDYFGSTSSEATIAGVYFNGFDNSNVKPGALLFTQYPSTAVSAYLRGGDLSSMTLAQLQALSGTLSIVIDGVLKTGSVNLGAATSFSNAGLIIANTLGIQGTQAAAITGSISGTTLTVSAVASGTLAVGDVLSGTGVTANTYITALASGTGGTGTYTVSASQTALSQSITVYNPAVQYDSVSGAFVVNSGTTGPTSTMAFGSGAMATSLLLTQITGAVLSQGTGAATPGAFMDAIINVTQNWATFMTIFDPDSSGNTNKLAFSSWTNDQNNRYGYVCWDTDLSPSVSDPASSSLGFLIDAADFSGTCLIGRDSVDYADLPSLAAFGIAYPASLDFTQTAGRKTMAFRSQSGLLASVTNNSAAVNLGGDPQGAARGNGYNFYGAYATVGDQFTFFNRGFVSGPFKWMDSYVNQIQLNNSAQFALVQFLTQAGSVPYNAAGRAAIESALADVINAALNFGSIVPGVTLSSAQIVQVNTAAGAKIDTTLSQRGWYLSIKEASPTVRAARLSPPCTLFYCDGGSVQALSLTSVELQ